MSQLLAALDSAWRVLAVGLVLGAGLPALFSIGIRQSALARVPESAGVHVHAALHRTLAVIIYVGVVLGVVLGLTYIIAHGLGYSIGFDGLMPVITQK